MTFAQSNLQNLSSCRFVCLIIPALQLTLGCAVLVQRNCCNYEHDRGCPSSTYDPVRHCRC